MDERFSREKSIFGDAAMKRLAASRVAVLGLGGVGSWCAEALCRAGIGELILADEDSYSVSNINRQLFATEKTVGQPKAEAAAERMREINPRCVVIPMRYRYEAETRERLFAQCPDYIVDAIDLVSCKLDLILTCRERGIQIISALGTGNKLDASQLRIADISETYGCPLARVMRKELKRRGVEHHVVVFSPEESAETVQTEAPPPGRRSVPGSVVWVPAAAGLLLAQYVVTSIINDNNIT